MAGTRSVFFWRKKHPVVAVLLVACVLGLRLFGVTAFCPEPIFVKETTVLLSALTSDNTQHSVPLQPFDCEDDFEIIQHFTLLAVEERGTPSGLEALRILSKKSKQRVPYSFLDDNKEDPHGRPGSVVKGFHNLLEVNVTQAFLHEVRELESLGWISTNPDSVDGLPSLHLNLVSHGKPIVGGDDFHLRLKSLLSLVRDPIYEILLPRVRELLRDPSIEVSDIFLRRYGQDVCQVSRRGISAHYDVFSRVTSVIALDDTAEDGRNGLFTTLATARGTSNHAAMRRFFPLSCGDGVVHTWDILHGVDVEPYLDRTSLIIWFTQGSKNGEAAIIAPWLLSGRRDEETQQNDNVGDFVLASAISSVAESGFDQETVTQQINAYPSDVELYLQSAAKGNTFALTRVGSLIEEQAMDLELLNKAKLALQEVSMGITGAECLLKSEGSETSMDMAMQFWYEGAIRGNPLAQRALADELMMRASENGDDDTRLLAAVFFALAAQQGDEEAMEALSRVVAYDTIARGVEDEQGYSSSPVVQIAQAALVES